MTPRERQAFWNTYLEARRGTYEFRCRRYEKVADFMLLGKNPLSRWDTIVDLGGGRGEFGLYLRERFPKLNLTYVNIDGSIDGVDLQRYDPVLEADFYVSIEVIEHLESPWRMLAYAAECSRKAVIITTPNARVTDVLGMDATHRTPITVNALGAHNFTEIGMYKLFTADRYDTLVARKRGLLYKDDELDTSC